MVIHKVWNRKSDEMYMEIILYNDVFVVLKIKHVLMLVRQKRRDEETLKMSPDLPIYVPWYFRSMVNNDMVCICKEDINVNSREASRRPQPHV